MAYPREITNKRTVKSICTQYGKGKTLAQLADRYGVAVTTIRNYLLENGVTMRRRGGPSK